MFSEASADRSRRYADSVRFDRFRLQGGYAAASGLQTFVPLSAANQKLNGKERVVNTAIAEATPKNRPQFSLCGLLGLFSSRISRGPHPRIIAGSDFGPIEDSNLSANFRSAENAKLSVKRVSAPDPEHAFQTPL
ncbi:hypothetical protein GFL85_18580 [Rhizobium laguerreae]|nr:hypothetical protein [Rhizobium laguerreae]